MLSTLVLVPCLDIGRIFPTDLGSPSAQLARASRTGDFAGVRRCFLDYDSNTLDLDTALCAAAAHSHMGIVGFLVTFGASDLEHALLCAVLRDNVRIAAYLTSKERSSPATNLKEAQTLAANVGSLNCEWMLMAHYRRGQRES